MSNVSKWVKQLVDHKSPFVVSKCVGDVHGLVGDGTQVTFSVRDGSAYLHIKSGTGDEQAWNACPLVGFEVGRSCFLVGQIKTKAGAMPLLVSAPEDGSVSAVYWQLDGESLSDVAGAGGGGGSWNTGP